MNPEISADAEHGSNTLMLPNMTCLRILPCDSLSSLPGVVSVCVCVTPSREGRRGRELTAGGIGDTILVGTIY